MKVILNFIYKHNHYVLFEKENEICLFRYNGSEILEITKVESLDVKSLISYLIDDSDNVQLLRSKVIVLNKIDLSKFSVLNKFIVLSLNENQKNNLIQKCDLLNIKKTGKSNKSRINKYFVFIGVLLLIVLGSFAVITEVSKNNFLKKYTYIEDEKNLGFYDMKYELVNIKHENYDGLFEDVNVSFYLPNNNYVLDRCESISCIYKDDVENSIVVMKMEDFYVDTLESLQNYMVGKDLSDIGISFDSVIERNNIKDDMDIIYNVVKYSSKEVNKKSSKDEIIDKYVFDYIAPIKIPYSKQYNNNSFIFFEGDILGYCSTYANMNVFDLKKGNDKYTIIFGNNKNEVLSRKEIINIAKTIVLK